MSPKSADSSPLPAPEVTLHEERVDVVLERVATERVHIERVVVVEQRTITVDVRREEIRVTREPLDGAIPPLPKGHRPAEPIVILLREEQLDIHKVVVPVERVTVTVETVSTDTAMTETVAREQVDVVRSRSRPQ